MRQSFFFLMPLTLWGLISYGGVQTGAADGDAGADNRAVISGIVTDKVGRPLPDASLRLERNGSDVALTRTDSTGSYRMSVVPLSGTYDLSATRGDLGEWLLNLTLHEGDPKTINLTLKEAVSISGKVSTPDSATADVPVQAVLDRSGDLRNHPYTIAVTLTDKEGRYRFVNLKPGRYQLWCVMPGERIPSEAKKNTAPTVQVERGKALTGIDFRLAPLKQRSRRDDRAHGASGVSTSPVAAVPLRPFVETKTYVSKDGADAIEFAVADTQGYTWFRPVDVKLFHFYRFDGKRFMAVDTVGSRVSSGAIGSRDLSYVRDKEGKVWIGGDNGIVQLWNGKVEKHYTLREGLASNAILAVGADKYNGIWTITTKGICYIHKENGKGKVSAVVDSSRVDLSEAISKAVKTFDFRLLSAGISIDSESGVWWWTQQPPDSTTIVHRLLRTPQGSSEVQKIQPSFEVIKTWPIGAGLLIKGIKLDNVKFQVGPRLRRCAFRRLRVERDRLTRCLMTRAVACLGDNCFKGKTA